MTPEKFNSEVLIGNGVALGMEIEVLLSIFIIHYNHYFRFNKSGKVVIHKTHSFLDRRMHLNLQTVTTKREFL